jgi:hypothetical protein
LPFEEISIFSNGGHLGYRTALTNTNFKRGPPKDHSDKVWLKLAEWFLTTFADFDRLCKLEKRGDEIKKKSSLMKLRSQSQPKFAEMILGWSPSKIVSGISDLRPRWPPQPNLI